jgi:hypothetical protein
VNLPFEGYLRRRDAREAADAGLMLWRENFIFFLPFFAIPFWICAFGLRMLPGNMQYFSWIILWFLKPLFDRPVLHIISVRFFHSNADMKHLLKGLGQTLWRGLLGDLLWRRFSPLRSAMMPVRVLEARKKSGREAEKRNELLKKGGLGYCFLLSFWGLALEAALLVGEILFFSLILQLFDLNYLFSNGDFPGNIEIFIFAAWCFNYMLVETLYVCMGFGVYINSRIEVKGWNLEIMFRSFAEKIKKKKINSGLILLCLVCLLVPVKTSADEIPLEKLQNIFDSPDFGSEEETWGIRLKNPREPRDIPDFNINPMIERLRWIFAFVLRFILICLIAALAVILFLFARKYKIKNSPAKNYSITVPQETLAENPQLLLKKAVDFFEKNDLRMAWGFCTAAAILSWPLYRGIIFPPNATESDCANIVSSTSRTSGEAEVFSELINQWVNFAYAGRLPPAGSFEKAVSFCKSLGPANG